MRVSSLCWGVILVGIGVFFLAINIGYLNHYVWVKLVSLWPVILIAIGIAIIFSHSKMKYLALLAPLIFALTFAYVGVSEWGSSGSYSHGYKYSSHYSSEVFEYQIDPDPEVRILDIEIDFGLGDMKIGATSKELFNGDFKYHVQKPDIRYRVDDNGRGRLSIKSRDLKRLNVFKRRNIKKRFAHIYRRLYPVGVRSGYRSRQIRAGSVRSQTQETRP